MSQRLIDEIQRMIDDTLASVHTAMPGTISVANGVTATVKPSVTYKTPDGKNMAYPTISGCPIVLPMSADGKIGVAFPVSAGDACLIVCSESTLSQWQSGSYQSGVRHGLSNAVCIPCLMKSAPAAVSKAKAQNAALLFSDENEVLCGKDEISATFKEKQKVTIKENSILAEVGDDVKFEITQESVTASVKGSTKVTVKDKEITALAGDEDHSIVLQDALAMLKIKDAKVLLSKELATMSLDEQVSVLLTQKSAKMALSSNAMVEITPDSAKVQISPDIRVEAANSHAGVYFDSGHYIEARSDKTHVEGDLTVSGSVTEGSG